MPVDPMYTAPMLDPFRNMMAEIDGKGMQGEDVNSMRAHLGRMEELALQCNDIAAYSGLLAQEGCFQKFSEAYSRCLSQAAASSTPQSDEEMLAQARKSYADALAYYQSPSADEGAKKLIPFVQQILTIADSGVSFPVFLRLVEEQGLTDALSGAAPAVRDGLVATLQFNQQAWLQFESEQSAKALQAYDQLVASAPFGQPDSHEFSLISRRLEWEYLPVIRRRQAEVRHWHQIIDLLVDWLDSYSKLAFGDERWRPPGASEAQVKRNIRRTQGTGPGSVVFRVSRMQKYFHIDWQGIWSHPSFTWEYGAGNVGLNDERLQLAIDTYPLCIQSTAPSPELISKAEALWGGDGMRHERNPPWGQPLPPFQPRPGSI